jgi:FlaA1/EpsC-like NDP-sugar epimerase
MGVDWVLALVALAVAHLLRLGHVDLAELWPVFVVIPLVTILLFSGVGVYAMVIRFSGLDEMAPVLKGVVLSSLALLISLFLLHPDPNPRSLFVIYGLVLLVFCAGSRHLWRSSNKVGAGNRSGVPTAIYGAGDLGRQVMQICRNGTDYQPVVWLDDDPKYHGRNLARVEVLDPQDSATPERLKHLGVETILMAIPSVSGSKMKGLLESLRRFNCSVRTLPSIEDIMSNRVTSIDAKRLPLEELIGRQPVTPDMKLMIKNVTGKVVMVTGAGGSVGSELCRQILPLRPIRLVLFDVSEAAMYQIEQSLGQLGESMPIGENTPDICCTIGNVNRRRDVESAISSNGVQTLFHAAAYKHVPMVEKNPQPAVRTNIGGTRTTLEASIRCGVENFLLISTDKAVRPTNIMGATKRVAEMVVQAKAEDPNCETNLSIVRFGNVIGSSGSVVPKFSEQIASGGPVTVTHKDIVRYFMSIPEAAQLVIQASAMAEGGDVFLLNMGEPVQIADLAKSLVFLHGKTLKDETNPRGEIEIKYTGLRPGEKLYEELLIDETAVPTSHPKISRARESYLPWAQLRVHLDRFEAEMESNPNGSMIQLLCSVVPGYVPDKRSEAAVSGGKEAQHFLRVS